MGEQEQIKSALLVGYSDGYQDSRDGVQYDSTGSLRRHLALCGIDEQKTRSVVERTDGKGDIGDQPGRWSVIKRAADPIHGDRVVGTSFTAKEARVVAEVVDRVGRSPGLPSIRYAAECIDHAAGRWAVLRIEGHGVTGTIIGHNFDEREARHCAATLTMELLK